MAVGGEWYDPQCGFDGPEVRSMVDGAGAVDDDGVDAGVAAEDCNGGQEDKEELGAGNAEGNFVSASCCDNESSDDAAGVINASTLPAPVVDTEGQRRAHSSCVSLNTRLQCLSKALKAA
jgi:hypothetical protein